MGGKAIKPWTEDDKTWLRSRFVVCTDTAQVFLKDTGKEIIPCRVGPSRKQYLAVAAKISGKWTKVRLHILVWFFATGKQSMKMIDHKEGNPVDQITNRYSNLREATDKQNRANIARKGYHTKKDSEGNIVGYFARMSYKCSSTGRLRSKQSPVFDKPKLAQEVYFSWQRQHHKEFAYQVSIDVSCGSNVNVD